MKREKGAIVVEASIALTAFIFAIYTILSIADLCFIQAKIGVSLNTAAKEISQYSYLYYALGADGLDGRISKGTENSQALAQETIDGVVSFMDALENAGNSAQSGDFGAMFNEISQGADNVDSLITKYADQLKSDPKGFILGMGKMAANNLKEEGKAVLAQTLAKAFMQKNLISNPNDSADAFLKRYRVVDGMAGLDFDYTTFLVNGTSNEIQLVVTYDIQVIRLLNLDYKFKIRQCSKTQAWGNGITAMAGSESGEGGGSQGTSSVWNNKNVMERGKIIVAAEKSRYTYTSSGQGFDAYDNANGKNEFVSIISVNTHENSFRTVQGIKSRLSSYGALQSKVNRLGEEITVQNQSGQTVTLHSDKATRTCRLVLVVPDDADLDMVNQAVREYQQTHPGANITVRQGYGSPTGDDAQENA